MELLIAVAIGVGVFVAALWAIRLLATPPPPEPDPDEVDEVEVAYGCTVCGMQLTVTYAQRGDEVTPPKHCREEMVPIGDR